MSNNDLLIQGGTVVDGTGAAARRADVRTSGGRIVEVGPSLAPDGEAIIDAHGAFVTPGFIESHTHYDGSMWWDPSLSPAGERKPNGIPGIRYREHPTISTWCR